MLSGGKISKRSIWGAEENSTKVCVFSFDIFSDFCFKCTFLHTWPGKKGRRDIAWAIFKRSEISLVCMYLKLGIQSQYLYYQRFYRGVHVCTWGIHRDIIHEKYVRTIQEYTLNLLSKFHCIRKTHYTTLSSDQAYYCNSGTSK